MVYFAGLSLVVEVICGERRLSPISYGILYILFLQPPRYHGLYSYFTVLCVLIPHVSIFLDPNWYNRILCCLCIP